MVTRYFGYNIGRNRLRTLLNFADYGTPSSNIIHLRTMGFNVQYGKARDELPLYAAIARRVPPICFVQTEALHHWEYSTGHALVVAELSTTNVVVNDPAFALRPIVLPFEEFMLAWSDRDMEYALVWPE